MKISHVKIHNILGISDLEFKPGQFTEITGGNGVNKTSLLNAIKSVVEGGHDATLLRNGADKGEIVLVLDDGVELKKTVTAKTSRTEVKSGETLMKRPMETIAALADLFSVNPIAFLSAPKADRARVLLESMPIALDQERLAGLAGIPVPPVRPGTHPMTIIDMVRKQVYDARTVVNRAHDEKRSTVLQLQRTMPDAPGDIQGGEDEIEAQLAAIDSETREAIAGVDAKMEDWAQKKNAQIESLTANHNAEVAALREKISLLVEEHQSFMGELKEKAVSVSARAAARRQEITADAAARRAPLAEALGTLRANRGAVAKREQALKTISEMDQAATILKMESDERTAALDAIDAYNLELLSRLPIPGIEVVNGEIIRDGIPFDRLNTAQRTDIAIEIAKLRAGKLGFVSVDGLELLDQDAYEAFQAKAVASGLQFFVTRVGRGALQINAQ